MTLARYSAPAVVDWINRQDLPGEQVDVYANEGFLALELANDLCLDYQARLPHLLLLDAYYNGEPPLPREPERITEEYQSLLEMSRENWCQLVVDIVDERLKVGSISSTANPVQDETAWMWWNRNNMDGVAPQIHNTALRLGLCYSSAWPTASGVPRMLGESPLTTYVRFDPESGEPIAAIRLWMSCCGSYINADLTTPNAQWKLVTTKNSSSSWQSVRTGGWGAYSNYVRFGENILAETDFSAGVEWAFRDPIDGVPPMRPNPMGIVPYTPFYTMLDLNGGYRSELESILPIQDRINKTTFDRMVSQEFTAFPQRWITGIDTVDPKTGKRKLPFDAAADRVWTADDPATEFGQFTPSTGEGYLAAKTADIQALASQTRTPPSYLMAGMGIFPSGESVKATNFGLSRKVQSRQQTYGDGWSRHLRVSALAAGNEQLANDHQLGVVWEDMEARSEGEVVDALLKMATLGVPWEALWSRWGADPKEIADWSSKLDDTLKRSQMLALAAGNAGRQSIAQPHDPAIPPIRPDNG